MDIIVIAVVIISLSVYGALHLLRFAVAREKAYGREIVDYTYDYGTTVWEMAERHCPDTLSVREMAREIERVNGIKNHIVYEGAMYKIPVFDKEREGKR